MKPASRREFPPATGRVGRRERAGRLDGAQIIAPAPGQGPPPRAEIPLRQRVPRASTKKTTVLLVDDNAAVRRGLRALLETGGHAEVVGQARNGRQAVKMAWTLRPDVILMDIAMPVLNGLGATRQILAANPAAKVLIISVHSDDEYVDRVIAVGAAGFLEKLAAAELLPTAIREVAKGNLFFSSAATKRMAHRKE